MGIMAQGDHPGVAKVDLFDADAEILRFRRIQAHQLLERGDLVANRLHLGATSHW